MESTDNHLEAHDQRSDPALNLPPLGYQERPLLPRERRLLKRLSEQHVEGVLWLRFFIRMLPSLGFFVVYVALVGFSFGWQSTVLLIVVGMLTGMLLMNFTYQRLARRNWRTFDKIINWQYVDQLRARDAERRQ